jgi:hypothetical protein
MSNRFVDEYQLRAHQARRAARIDRSRPHERSTGDWIGRALFWIAVAAVLRH